jgi:flagellar basal body-associated protein FliL
VRRIILLMTVLAVMALMAVMMAVPAFADSTHVHNHHNVTTTNNQQQTCNVAPQGFCQNVRPPL